MNINNCKQQLVNEEQRVLDRLIRMLDQDREKLDILIQSYVDEAHNADISVNPDLYLSHLLAQKGLKDTKENRKRLLQSRDELYQTRLLLQYEDETGIGFQEVKVGLHSCIHNGKHYIMSWTRPLFRHYLLDNVSTDYDYIHKGDYGKGYKTHYKLLVKNQIELRFTHVKKVINMFPVEFDDKMLNIIRGKDFFSDSFLDDLISKYNPEQYKPEEAADLIYDEFLQELLERRSTAEFKNIVFSIQKKQGEIIQAPYSRNMVVQGCAGSGKSMIMLHRLPILLYDHPDSLKRTHLYIITPSEMYVQLAESMRHQLEISDIKMGTLEQYYDHCIEKYQGRTAYDYGKISYGRKLSKEDENYIYSEQCIKDVNKIFEKILTGVSVSLTSAYSELGLRTTLRRRGNSYAQRLSFFLIDLQEVLNANNSIIIKYFKHARDVIIALRTLRDTLDYRKKAAVQEVMKRISFDKDAIKQREYEISKLDPIQNAIAIKNRKDDIARITNRVKDFEDMITSIESDESYFSSIDVIGRKINKVIKPFNEINLEYSIGNAKEIYEVIYRAGELIGAYYMIAWELSKTGDKYSYLLNPINLTVQKVESAVSVLQNTKDRYLTYDYYCKIIAEQKRLSDAQNIAIRNAYESIMERVGIKRDDEGTIIALRCSPYLYLQILYQYQGAPVSAKETLLAIDEAQGIAPVEIELLRHVNGDNVILNMYGDVHQHIEGTKGVDSWDEYKNILDFDYHEMNENYRNASQITSYCNRRFNMNMVAINTTGKGVHEIDSKEQFRKEMINQLIDTKKTGLSAILVRDSSEAEYITSQFSGYRNKFHDMTGDEFSIHRSRWNIITIDEAKGLEFNTVFAISGHMTENQKYIAFTRALDDLYIYDEAIESDGSEYHGNPADENIDIREDINGAKIKESTHRGKTTKSHNKSEVREYFVNNGLEVIDNRDAGGRLWVVGEKERIRFIVNSAIERFRISGKYGSSSEINKRNGWYTKTDK